MYCSQLGDKVEESIPVTRKSLSHTTGNESISETRKNGEQRLEQDKMAGTIGLLVGLQAGEMPACNCTDRNDVPK